MKRIELISVVVSVLMLFVTTGICASATGQEPYSADRYYSPPGGTETLVGKRYVDGLKMRMELLKKGKQGVAIIRQDKQVIWTLIPNQKRYLEMPLDPEKVKEMAGIFAGKTEREELGRKNLRGYKCIKYRIRHQDPVSGKHLTAIVWLAEELGANIRIEDGDGSLIDLRNIEIGRQPDSLFEVPPGYQRIDFTKMAGGFSHAGDGSQAPHSPHQSHASAPAATSAIPETVAALPAQPDIGDLLFANSDFEAGTLENWTTTGNAFDFQPTMGDNPVARKRRQPSKHQGKYWIGTFEKYSGGPGQRPGRVQSDQPMGTLTSVPFVISSEQIVFLVGGGKYPAKECVTLMVDGRDVRSATGKNNETMRKEVWDVREFAGKQATIVIKDLLKCGWGHINADYFHFEGGRTTTDAQTEPEAGGSTSGLAPKEESFTPEGSSWNDIPVYPGAEDEGPKPCSGKWAKCEKCEHRTYITTECPEKACDFYKMEMPGNGWNKLVFQKYPEGSCLGSWIKQDSEVRVFLNIGKRRGDKKTYIGITRGERCP